MCVYMFSNSDSKYCPSLYKLHTIPLQLLGRYCTVRIVVLELKYMKRI